MQWFCGHCRGGPMTIGLDQYCVNCLRARDAYSDPPPSRFREQRSQGSSTSFEAAHPGKAAADLGRSAGKVDISSAQSTSEGASPKSGSLIDSRHNVTPEERFISLSKISKHAHGPPERELPFEEPVDQAQHHKKSKKKSGITTDEISIREDTYE